jgi:hypothetical protein
MEDLEKIFGLLIYASYVLAIPMHTRYYAFKLVRRRFSLLAKDLLPGDEARIWPSTYHVWKEWVDNIVTHPGRQARTKIDPNYILITDASQKGYGGIVFPLHSSQNQIRTHSGSWQNANVDPSRFHINELEMKALVLCADMLVPRGARLIVLVDNTTVLHTVEAGRSRNYTINNAIGQLRSKFSVEQIKYIRSEENPADNLSRAGKDTSLTFQDRQLLVKAVKPHLDTEEGVDFRDKI